VKAEFAKRWTTGEGDPEKRKDAARKAFERALTAARDKRDFAFETTDADELVWLIREPQADPDAAHRFEPVPGTDGEFYLHRAPGAVDIPDMADISGHVHESPENPY
jgi:hypothetical protein